MTRGSATASHAPGGFIDVIVEASRALVHAIAWGVWVASFAAWESVFVAVMGGFVGCVVGRALSHTRLRFAAGVSVALSLLVLGWIARASLVGSLGGTLGFGPALALRFGDLVFWCLAALSLSAAFRFASSRVAALAVFELLLVGSAFAQAFMAHRHGLINRPFEVADFWIAANLGDPSWIFVGLGAIAAALGLVLFLRENRLWRALLHLGVIAALLLFVSFSTRVISPKADGGLGLRPDKASEKEKKNQQPGQGQGQRQQERPNNEDLEFRDQYNPSGNQAPMAVVLFHDDYSPPTGIYYFRQSAFSQYNGRKLVPATRGDVDRDLIPAFPTDVVKVPVAPEQNENRKPLETTVALMADHARPFAIEAPVEVRPVSNPDPARFRRIYRAMSNVMVAQDAELLNYDVGSSTWTEEEWTHYTQSPEDKRYPELAKGIVAQLPKDFADDPIAKAFAITDWLSREGIYSLKNKHSGAQDPVASFVFGDKVGYCVHFAHAAVYLMRTQGVPARIGTGYAVEEAQRQGGSALLLGGSASHAWPEVYVDKFGWVVLDVYPQSATDPPPQPMDADLQRLLGELARGATPVPPSMTDVSKLKELARDLGLRVGLWCAFVIAALLVWMFTVKVWRQLIPVFVGDAALARVLYRAELDRLSEISIRRRRGESREAFARRLVGLVPAFENLTFAHVQGRFGQATPNAAKMREDARHARAQLQQGIPRWRRFLGRITPWSWLTTR